MTEHTKVTQEQCVMEPRMDSDALVGVCLGWEDPLEKVMATHSSTLAWRIRWREEPGGVQSMGSQKLDTTKRLNNNNNMSRNPNFMLNLLILVS